MKVVIAGASGFIGSHLAGQLAEKHSLLLTDRVEADPDKVPKIYEILHVDRKREYLPKLSPSLPFVVGDVTDYDFCRRITEGMDAVVLLAASTDYNDPVSCFRTNTVGTFNLLEACAQHGVRRVLAASSINACGLFYCRYTDRSRHWAYLPVDEAIPTDHEDAYSLSKYCNELSCAAWTNRTELTTAAFRFSGVWPREATEVWKKRVGPASQWPETLAEYVDIRDIVSGLEQALDCVTLPRSGVYQLSAADTLLLEPTMEVIERFRPDLLGVLKKELPGHTSMLSHARAWDAFRYDPRYSWRG